MLIEFASRVPFTASQFRQLAKLIDSYSADDYTGKLDIHTSEHRKLFAIERDQFQEILSKDQWPVFSKTLAALRRQFR